jgi:uncharacterized protein
MKKSMILIALVLSNITFAQKSTVGNDIKMYEQVWDNIVNKDQIDLINDKNFDSNITLISQPENIVGIEAFKSFYQNYISGFSEKKFTIVEILSQGNKIVKQWNFKGKHTGTFFGIPPTGKSVDLSGVTIAVMKNGKIAQEQDFMDSMVFLQQLGLVSDPNNTTIVDNLYKAFAKGDIPTALSYMDTEIVWNEAEGNKYADGNPYIGPDAVLNGVFGRVVGEHDFFSLDGIELHEMSNNKVLATLRYKGKYKNGKEYNAQVAHFWTLKDGKISCFQQYVDTKKLNDALNK